MTVFKAGRWFSLSQRPGPGLGHEQPHRRTLDSAGHLKAKRRWTERTEQQGGDTYLIHEKDVRRFILKHPTEIDLRKVRPAVVSRPDHQWAGVLRLSPSETGASPRR